MERLPRRFGDFTLLNLRGKGGSGSVYLARPNAPTSDPDRAIVIIKILHQKLHERPLALARFRHEAMLAVSVSSPYIGRVFDVGTVDGVPYIVMELIEGWSLYSIMVAAVDEGMTLPPALVAGWLVDALRGLDTLHTAVEPITEEPLEVVHRDIAPKNLMVGEDLKVRVIDLGLGTSTAQDWNTAIGSVIGTPSYMSPEQRAGTPVGPRSDIYSLGIVAWELLTLKKLVKEGAPNLRPIGRQDVPPALEQAVMRALSVDPAARFGSAAEMRAAIEPFAIGMRPPSAIPRALYGELAALRDEITVMRNIREDTTEAEPVLETTVIFARRPSVAEPTLMAATQVGRTMLLPSPRRAGHLKWIAGAALASLGFVGAMSMWPEPPPVVQEPEKAEPVAIPAASVGVVTASIAEPVLDLEPPPSPRVVEGKRRPKPSAASPSPLPSPSPKPPATPQEALAALTRRAVIIRERRPELRAQIDELLADAVLWTQSRDPQRARTQLAELSRRLADMEKR